MKFQGKIRVTAMICAVAMLVGILSGCGPQNGPALPSDSPQPAESAKPAESAQPSEKPKPTASPDGDGEDGTESDRFGVEHYLSVERIETPACTLELPRINTDAFPGNDAVLAEQMFRSKEDELRTNAEEYAKEAERDDNPLGEEERKTLKCVTSTALNDDVLSILVTYQQINYYTGDMTMHRAVSLNVKTGEVVSPAELLELAGYDPEEASSVLRTYAEDCITSQWLAVTFWRCAADNTLPDGWGDPIPGWEDELEAMLREVWMEPQPTGESWDVLECSPAMFYEGGDRLSVSARIPTMAGAGFEETMVNLGHSPAAIHYRNPLDCYGEPFCNRIPMTEETACCAAAHASGMGADEFRPVSMGIVEDGRSESAYILETSDGASWAVGVFSATVWEERNGDWQAIPDGTGALSVDVMTAGKHSGAMAAVYNSPDEYEVWAADPGEMVDLTVYGSDPDSIDESRVEKLLLYAMEDGTTIHFQSGATIGGQFEPQSTFYSLELDEGQCVCVYVVRALPGESPSQCIDVERGGSVARYLLQATEDELPTAEYLCD